MRRRRFARTLLLLLVAAPAAGRQAPPAPVVPVPAPPSAPTPTPAADEPPAARHFEVAPATSKVRIDGQLDEPAWSAATVIDLPYEFFPGDNVPPPVVTECLVTFDDRRLYVAFRVGDPKPEAIRAHLMERDNITGFLQDDYVGFQLDPFNDERRAFQFRVNPLGVQFDAFFSEVDGVADTTWDGIWDAAARLSAEGWTAEFAVPFQQLRFPRAHDAQTWGFFAFRSYPRSVVHRISSKLNFRAKRCQLCGENKLTGFAGISPGRNLEIAPTATALRTDRQAVPLRGDLVAGDEDLEPGLSARWGITSNLILNATANPDFSQVEADSAQLEVNTRFALFFPEKRPFFLEGADFFVTPLEAVFTRTLVDPAWGVKLTGKEGGSAFGVFLAEDDRNSLIFPSNQASGLEVLAAEVTSGVFRYRRDLGARSLLGVLYTGREADDYHNRLLGVDGQVNITDSDTFRFQAVRSETLYPEAVARRRRQSLDEFGGEGLFAHYEHQAKTWRASVGYRDLDPEFRADSGFVPRVDVRTAEAALQRILHGKRGGWYTRIDAGLRGLRTEDHGGRLTDETFELFGIYQGALQSTVELVAERTRELVGGTTFELDRLRWLLQASPSGKLRLTLVGRAGDEVDVDNVRPGEVLSLTPSLQWRLGRRLSANLSHQAQWLDVAGGELFEAHLSQLRLVYQFDVRTAVRAIVQRTDITREPGLYTFRVEPESERVFSQLLFSWKLNPQTVLFLGYTDTRQGLRTIDLTQTDRTFFAKVGYAFLL
jgi:Domain of unknown function (DUF5916)